MKGKMSRNLYLRAELRMRSSLTQLEPNQSCGNNVSSLYFDLHQVRTKANSHYQSVSCTPRSCIIQITREEKSNPRVILKT